MLSVTPHFPHEWLVTVTVKRGGGVDPKGIPLPTTEHEVADYLVTQMGSEVQVRNDDPSTTCWIYDPTGGDFVSSCCLFVPDGTMWSSGEFEITGRPSRFPMGLSVPLREV